jgi:hypothetical protein
LNNGGRTRTHIFDVRNLDSPIYRGFYSGAASTIDHNQFVKGCYVYQSNYESGLRVLSIGDPSNPTLKEVAYFDTYDTSNVVTFNGSWGNYPYFDSGTIAVTDRPMKINIRSLFRSWPTRSSLTSIAWKLTCRINNQTSGESNSPSKTTTGRQSRGGRFLLRAQVDPPAD